MPRYKIKFKPLPTQADIFNDDKTTLQMYSGGYGCFSHESILNTIDGGKTAQDIHRPTVYYSKNDRDQLSLFVGTAPYPKGKDYLYRVVHEQGEFVVTLSHQIFFANGSYLPLGEALSLYGLENLYIHHVTSPEYDLLKSRVDDLCLKKICEDFLCRYGEYIHQYGQQLQSSKDTFQDFFPLPYDAQVFDQKLYGLCEPLHEDARHYMKREHSHLSQFCDLTCKKDCCSQFENQPEVDALSNGIYPKVSGLFSECNSLQSSGKQPCLSEYRPSIQQLGLHQNHNSISSFPYLTSSKNVSKILSVEKVKYDWFYDVHVFGSNNYMMSNSYHHNSGKTFVMAMKAIKLSMQNGNHAAGGIVVPTYSDFKKDIFPTISDICDANRIPFKFHQTDKAYYFPWAKYPIYIFTAERPIKGPNLGWACVNEYSLIEFDRIAEIIARVRVKNAPNPQKILVGTPEDLYGWLHDFVDSQKEIAEKKENYFKIHFADTSQNTHISDDYRRLLESVYDEQSLKVYAQGQIVKLGGNFFYIAFDDSKNVSGDAQYIQGAQIYGGMDFNVGKMSATFSHKSGSTQIYFKEIYLTQDGSNTYTMARAIKNAFPELWNSIIFTVDASGNARKSSALETAQSDVQILRNEGFNVRFKSANPRLKYRQLLVNSKLKNSEIIFHPDMKHTIKDMRNVKQKDDYTKDAGKKNELGHLSDTVDYCIDYLYDLDLNKDQFKISRIR